MWKWLFGKSVVAAPEPQGKRSGSLFSTDDDVELRKGKRAAFREFPLPTAIPNMQTVGTDDSGTSDDFTPVSVKQPLINQSYYTIPNAQIAWYAAQGFIGFQICAQMAQHWLISKACYMPGNDAIRKGYDISSDDGTDLDPAILSYIRKKDKEFKINWHLKEFAGKGRIFGIRIAIFKVVSEDPEYYSKPFNIDGVTPGSYKGIVQVDPYWCSPLLTTDNVQSPDDLHFYEPDFWRINSTTYHRSHLIIFTTGEVPDVLKSAYSYAGVSVPQRIFERVYAAERCANEIPMLAMTKRLTVMNTDLEAAMADQQSFETRMEWWRETRDNHGVKINGLEDKIEQFDLSLTDMEVVTMAEYQLVAAGADVPGTKLIGTQPKGFNSTGEFEESSYHEFLETLRSNNLSPLLYRHHALVVQAYIKPKFGKVFDLEHSWNELDAMTADDQATVNATKAETDAVLLGIGAIDSQDVRNRIINDRDSGYNDLSAQVPPPPAPPPMPGAQPGQPGAAPPSGGAAGAVAKAQTLSPKPPKIRPSPTPGA